MRLSDLYEIPEENPVLEIKVLVLNINRGNNEELTEKCKTLKEYMLYIERIRYYIDAEKKSLKDAVETAVDECIKEGILADFLRKNKAEAIAVSIFEYDEEKEIRLIKEAERDVEKIENIKLMMKNLNLTAEQAMDVLEIPEEKRGEYLPL